MDKQQIVDKLMENILYLKNIRHIHYYTGKEDEDLPLFSNMSVRLANTLLPALMDLIKRGEFLKSEYFQKWLVSHRNFGLKSLNELCDLFGEKTFFPPTTIDTREHLD